MRLILLLILVSCSSTSLIPRTSLMMGVSESFLYSNGSTHPFDSIKSVGNKRYEIQYSIVIKNKAASEKSVVLNNLLVTINDDRIPLACKFGESNNQKLTLSASEMAQIDCVFEVQSNSQNKMANQDTVAKIQLTLNKDKIAFEYHFRIEDFKDEQISTINSGADRSRAK